MNSQDLKTLYSITKYLNRSSHKKNEIEVLRTQHFTILSQKIIGSKLLLVLI